MSGPHDWLDGWHRETKRREKDKAMTIIESLEATCDLLNEKLPGKGYWIARANGMFRLVEGTSGKARAVTPWMDSPQALADWLAPYYQGVCAAVPERAKTEAEHVAALAQDRADLEAC